MSDKRQQFIGLLHELFQLDQPELDFGFYKIMHAKSGQIQRFIDEELSTYIDDVFAGRGNQAAEDKVAQARQAILDNVDPDAFEHGELKPEYHGSPAGQRFLEAQRQLREGGALSDEAQVYDHLYRFFSRYYDQGDFLSTRYRQAPSDTRDAPYSVPYDGREVYLHWANKDQYYIKSSETLRHYGFDLNAAVRQLHGAPAKGGQSGFAFGDDATPRRVQFQIVDAAEGAHGNVKENEQRFFRIHAAEPIILTPSPRLRGEGGGEGQSPALTIQFEYRPDPAKSGQNRTWQDKRLAEAEAAVFEALAQRGETGAAFKQALAISAPTEKDDRRTLLAKHLRQYTARHSMDYFIHKDLGAFLRRELDFYIKNEVMRLDHIESAEAPAVSDYLEKVKVIRRIARRIIEFLAQLEDFQKKLWLKKKFVTETNYCVTLDRVPEVFYEEIAANVAQRNEWCELFRIDEIQGELDSPSSQESLTVDFLKANPYLVIDTVHFDENFKQQLLATIENYDKQSDGLLIHTDNFHGLELLSSRHKNTVKSVYLDPPYNTDVSAIPYKNSYKHSSWATLMHDRLKRVSELMTAASACYVSIDKHERRSLEAAMDEAFGEANKVGELIWSQNTNDGRSPTFSTNHEYIEVYSKNITEAENDYAMFREPKPGYEEVMQLISELNPEYAKCVTIQDSLRQLYREHRNTFKIEMENQGLPWNEAKRDDPWNGIYQYKFAEYRNEEGAFVEEKKAQSKKAQIWVFRESDWTIMESDQKQSSTTKDPKHPNYRYYQPTHPITGKPSKMPSRGWKGTYKIDPSYPNRSSWESLVDDHRIAFGDDESKVPQQKRFLHEVDSNVAKSVIVDNSDGERETSDMFGRKGVFLAPKHSNFVSKFVLQSSNTASYVLDIFGGSGSTAGAVINCNRIDNKGRNFILMEANSYFDTIIIPRVKKTFYASVWKGGRAVSKNSKGCLFQYLRLESYEDALNNLVLAEDADRDAALEEDDVLRHDYMLRYWLDTETRGSASLLNVEQFRDPTNYRMQIKRPGGDESVEQPVDLVETFNWLIGLHVELLDKPRTFAAEFEREADRDLPEGADTRLRVKGRLKEREDGAHWFRTVQGWAARTPGSTEDVDKVLVIWRKLTDDPEQDTAALESLLANQLRINQRDTEFDAIYINGPHGLSTDFEGKHRLHSLEEAFHAAMWAVD